MPEYRETKELPYSIERLFAIVADVEKYPDFLPWCSAARVYSRDGNTFLADLVISFSGFTERYTSLVTVSPPDSTGIASITAALEKGSFKRLDSKWSMQKITAESTRVDFFVDFEFKSKILDKLMGSMFTSATKQMMQAFQERADKV